MNTVLKRSAALVAGLLMALAILPVAADDTDIFIASQDPNITGAKPNILFIYDNSGSMSANVTTQEDWNPNTNFNGCYNSNRVYFTTNNTPPTCSSNNWFTKTYNKCQASTTPLASMGSYSGLLAAWRSDTKKWVALSGSSNSTRNRNVECKDDRGVHGQNANDGKPWAANATGGWAATAASEPMWNNSYVLWDGNWLNWNASGGSVTKTRLEIVRDVTNNLLDSLEGVNVGLMHFNFEEGGTVAHQLADIAVARNSMKTAINALTASTWTPLAETLLEAVNYYMGRSVDYGNVGPVKSVAASRVGGVMSSNTYLQPISYACQKNFIIFLTDGQPTEDKGATSKVKNLPGWNSTVDYPGCSGSNVQGKCMADLAEYLFKRDLDPTLPGVQNVITHTIGFGDDIVYGDSSFLEETANRGGGRYFLADNTGSLHTALTSIVYDILDDATTFSVPAAPVNAFNRTTNLDEVYVSVFAPAVNEHWPGNLKRYALSNGQLVDATGQPAVDPDTGFFAAGTRSFWSASADGSSVQRGGAANQLPAHTTRQLFTDIAGGNLSAAANAVQTGNTSITAAHIGAPPADRDIVIDWARGLDVRDENDNGSTIDTRRIMGDPLHVRPVSVLYGGTEESPDAVVFISTNDGYLHAFDPEDGSELWAYIPGELLPRLYDLYLDEPVTVRSYGLDGDITVHIHDDDGVAGISGTERVILLFGMRRGGDTIYALDVTDRNHPELLWKIDSSTTGFERLGQTWSQPVTTQVKINSTIHDVAIFGGGYDDAEDLAFYRSSDAQGNAIYMIDILTGQLLWRAGQGTAYNLNLSAMTHAIPARLRVLDLDIDGLADRMYAGDMAGRVWRFDINNGKPASQLVDGGVFASLGGAAVSGAVPDSAARRFYSTPDVARIIDNNRGYLSINIGSGHRENPLDTDINDRFYALRDYQIYDPIPTASYPNPITEAKLEDITNDVSPTLPYNTAGWMLRMNLNPGEKILGESLTFDNVIVFTSFTPGGTGDACIAAGGLNRLYMISARDGAPVTNLDGSVDPNGSEELTVEDRYRDLAQGGIAPDPTVFFTLSDNGPVSEEQCDGSDCEETESNSGTTPTLCIGVECFDPGFANPPRRTHWTQSGTETGSGQ